MPLPDKIANAPELDPGLSLFYQGFLKLSGCRYKGGFGDGPIPWVAINQYCKYHGIYGEQREDFEYHIERMDLEYLKLVAKRSKTKDKPPPPKPGPRGGRHGRK